MKIHKKENRRQKTEGRIVIHDLRFVVRLTILHSVFLIFTLSSGCTEKAAVRTQNAVHNTQYAIRTQHEIMQIAENVLGEMYFTIDKADYEAGYIRTRPLSGAQFFEFWRKDNVGLDNQLLANLHSIRRIVEINIVGWAVPTYFNDGVQSTPYKFKSSVDETQNDIELTCTVHVQRLSLPDIQPGGNARVSQRFSTGSLVVQSLQLNPEQEREMKWIDLDDDKQLADEIIKEINKRKK